MYSKTILVQDANVQRRAQIRYTLAVHGYNVLEAGSPQEAETICSAKEVPVDLVIRDADAKPDFEWPQWRPGAPLLILSTFCESRIQDSPDEFWQLTFDPERLLSQVNFVLAMQTLQMDENNRGLKPSTAPVEAVTRAVLIVEDEETLRVVVSKTLRREGFSVIEAGDGTSAITLFRARQAEIELVLLDVNLPAMSGLKVFEELARIRPDIKVILTTACTREMVMNMRSAPQPFAFIGKPYRLTELVSLVREVYSNRTKG